MRLTSIIICLLLCTGSFAQKNIDVKEQVATMSKGDRTGYTIVLENANEKDVVKTLKTWLNEKQKKADISESGKHEIMATGFTTEDLGATSGNIYFLLTEDKNVITVTGFFEFNGTFVSSGTSADKVKSCENFMRHFGYRVEKLKIEDQLALAEKDLARKKDDQAELEKQNKQLNQQIAECEETIKKAHADLDQNGKDQTAKKEEIIKQQDSIDVINKDLQQYEKY